MHNFGKLSLNHGVCEKLVFVVYATKLELWMVAMNKPLSTILPEKKKNRIQRYWVVVSSPSSLGALSLGKVLGKSNTSKSAFHVNSTGICKDQLAENVIECRKGQTVADAKTGMHFK